MLGEGGLGSARVFRESLAPSDGDFQQLRVRELGETRREPRGDGGHVQLSVRPARRVRSVLQTLVQTSDGYNLRRTI